MEKGKEDMVYSSAVIEFVAVAKETAVFLEQAGSFPRSVFIDKSRKILPLLYYKAGLLPETDAIFHEGTEKFVTEDDWQRVNDTIMKKLGRYNDYPEVFDPIYRDTEDNAGGSIAGDMADIYQDIKDFLMVYRLGTVELMNDAVFECVQHFELSWGIKLLNTLRALHCLVYGGEKPGDEEEDVDDRKINTGGWIFSQRQKLWNEDED